MAEAVGAQCQSIVKTKREDLNKYDIVGFGSGIYFWRHSAELLKFVDKLSLPPKNKKAFVFSTSGIGFDLLSHRILKEKLIAKGFDILGEFGCKGYDTVGFLKILGGINKNRPNKKDLDKATAFIRQIAA